MRLFYAIFNRLFYNKNHQFNAKMYEEQYFNLHAVCNLLMQNFWNHWVIFPLRLLCIEVIEMFTTAIRNIKTLIWSIAIVNFDLTYTSRLTYYNFNRNEFSTLKVLSFSISSLLSNLSSSLWISSSYFRLKVPMTTSFRKPVIQSEIGLAF